MKKIKTLEKQKYSLISFLLPSLLGVSIFIIIPFFDSIRRSFCSAVTGEFVGVQNYSEIFKNSAFILALKNTALFTAVCLPILIFVSFIISFLLLKIKYIRIIKSCMLFPLAVPTATVVMIWRILFDDSGYINSFLDNTTTGGIHFLSTSAAFWVLVGSYLWKNLGYTVLLWVTGMSNISDSLTDAARTDGASEFQCLFRIILPNLKPTLYTITIISFLNSFKVFREAYLVAGSYPDKSMYLMQHLFNNWFVNLDLDKMSAAAVCIFSVIFAAIMFLQHMWDKED